MSGPPKGMEDRRGEWAPNDDGVMVPRRTRGSVADGYSAADFTLVCKHCGDEYGNEPLLPLGVVHAHFKQYHQEMLGPDGNAIQLELLWLGRGPAPKGKVS